MQAAKITISGEVQGVSYRYFAKRSAEKLGVNGYVKNLANGDVEAFVEGEKDEIESFIESLREGPSSSQVENINVEWLETSGMFKDFRIEY